MHLFCQSCQQEPLNLTEEVIAREPMNHLSGMYENSLSTNDHFFESKVNKDNHSHICIHPNGTNTKYHGKEIIV